MIEAHNSDDRLVLLNPREVVEVYRGDNFCNVTMTSGALHRFVFAEARRIYEALRAPVRLGDA